MKQLVLIAIVVLLSTSIAFAQDFCEGDFNYDGNVDGGDVGVFLEDFGRSQYFNPCSKDGPSPVPKTGQTTSWDTGDDGDLERGVAWPNPRFTDNGDYTVTDNLTGLMWRKSAIIPDYTLLWQEALEYVSMMNNFIVLGYSDWRLPNVRELQSLLHYGFRNPCLPNTEGTGQWSENSPFTSIHLDDDYWSSTVAQFSSNAFVVDMNNCVTSLNSVSEENYIWPVRGGH